MTTPNFGWPLIQPTDFVTDLPADFETFADAVDADLAGLLGGTTGQVLTKDSGTDYDFGWVTPETSPITTEGDLIVGNATGDPVRFPIGTTGQVLASDGDTIEWVSPPAPAANYTLLSTTTLSGTTAISGLSGYDNYIFVGQCETDGFASVLTNLNSSSTASVTNVAVQELNRVNTSPVASSILGDGGIKGASFPISQGTTTGELTYFYIRIEGALGTSAKPFEIFSYNANTGVSRQTYSRKGLYTAVLAFTSIQFQPNGSATLLGTVRTYGG